MSRFVNLYFNKPIDIRRAAALITREFDSGDVSLRKVGSDAFGFFATIEVTDKAISNNALKLIGDSMYRVVDVLDLKNYREDSEEPSSIQEDEKKMEKINPSKMEEGQKEFLDELQHWVESTFESKAWTNYLKKELMRDTRLSQVDKANTFKLIALMDMICNKIVEQEGGISNSTFLKISKWMSRITE